MHRTNRLLILLTPSVLSGVVCLMTTIIILGTASFTYYLGKGAFYDYLFGPHSSSELISQSQGTVSAFTNTVFGNQTLSKALFFGFWMIVGLIVYVILHIIIKGATTAAEDIQEASYKNLDTKEMLTSIGTRAAVRIAAFVGWMIYLVLFIRTITPTCILIARAAVTELPTLRGWLFALLGILIGFLSLHIHVVLLRLIALKPRLITSPEDVL